MAEPPKGLEVLKASYGVQGTFTDVTEQTKKLVKDGTLSFTVSPQTLGILDPAPGVKKTYQVNVSLNGAAPTQFTKDDGEQIVINSPTVKTDEKKDTPGGQVLNVVFYTLASVAGAYFAWSFYNFGTKGLKFWIVGVIGALVIVSSTITFAVAGSSFSGAGLFAFVLGIGFVQFWAVYFISLFAPNYIDFSYSKQVVEPVVQAVTEAPAVQ